MPMKLDPVPDGKIPRGAAMPVKEFSAKFPTKASPRADSDLAGWVTSQKPVKAPVNPDIKVKASPLTALGLAKFQTIVDSESAPGEMLNQKMDWESLIGILVSALTTYEYMKLQGIFQKQKSPADAKVTESWAQIVASFQGVFAFAGLKVTADDLNKYVKILVANSAAFNAVTRIANSAVDQHGKVTKPVASFLADTRSAQISLGSVITNIPNFCSQPLVQGSYTKHFSESFSLQVTVPYPCVVCSPHWWNCHIETCYKTVTLAGVSFGLDLNVGYKVNCCGVTVWGQAYAQACGTVVGVTVCASCSATIVGVAGISKTPVAGGCKYGLGVTAVLECKVAGVTVFYLSVPYGWTVTGPCPPIPC